MSENISMGRFEEDIVDPREFDVPLIKGNMTVKEEDQLHIDGLKQWVKNMDEDELTALTEEIPIPYLLKRFDKELREKIDLEERIDRMYKDFVKKG